MDRHWDENPKWCSNPTAGKLFVINLLFTTKQYKVDNIVNFVYYGKTRLGDLLRLPLLYCFKQSDIGSKRTGIQHY